MSIFEPLRDFFRRRAVKTLNDTAARVHLVNRRQESPRGNFVFPGTDYLDDIEVDGQCVGHVDYCINPDGDRLYINMLEINPNTSAAGSRPGCAVAPVAHTPGADCSAVSIHLIRWILVPGAPTVCSGRRRDKGRAARRRSNGVGTTTLAAPGAGARA